MSPFFSKILTSNFFKKVEILLLSIND